MKHLGEVLKVLEQAGLTVKKKKCEWPRAVLVYLGHEKKEIRAFLGTTGYHGLP